MGILLGGDVKIDGEDEVRPGEVQVHGQSHLHRDTDGSKSVKVLLPKLSRGFSGLVFRLLILYRVSLLGGALLDPAELSEGQLGGDGGGQRQLVVGTSCSL